MGQHPLMHITRDGLPVRVGDVFSGSSDGKKDLVDDEEEPFDSHPQEKTGYVVAVRAPVRYRVLGSDMLYSWECLGGCCNTAMSS